MESDTTDTNPNGLRTCVVCDQPIVNVTGAVYVHRLPQTTNMHTAQPVIAHPMDTDPFAGADPEEL